MTSNEFRTSNKEIKFKEPGQHPSGLSDEELCSDQGAVLLARWWLKPHLWMWLWDKGDDANFWRPIPVDRFLTERVRLNTEENDVEVDYVVYPSALEGASSIEKRALFAHCVDNGIQRPHELDVFMKKASLMSIRTEVTAAKNDVLGRVVSNVAHETHLRANRRSINQADDNQRSRQYSTPEVHSAVQAVEEAMRIELGDALREKDKAPPSFSTVTKAYQKWTRSNGQS